MINVELVNYIEKRVNDLADEFERKKDPEYEKYLELKKKFEGE